MAASVEELMITLSSRRSLMSWSVVAAAIAGGSGVVAPGAAARFQIDAAVCSTSDHSKPPNLAADQPASVTVDDIDLIARIAARASLGLTPVVIGPPTISAVALHRSFLTSCSAQGMR
jgi:hypothetical protein